MNFFCSSAEFDEFVSENELEGDAVKVPTDKLLEVAEATFGIDK